MFKKLIIASVIMSSSTGISYSNRVVCPTCPTYSFYPAPYVALSLGARNNYTSTPTVYQGAEGTLALGYGGLYCGRFFYNLSNWYMAAELFGGDSAQLKDYKNDCNNCTTVVLNNSVVINNGGAGVKSTWSYGFDLLPGVQLTDPVIAYLRLGVVRTRFSDQNTSATGFRAGIGLLTNIYQNWDLRAEYIFSSYRSINCIGTPRSNIFNFGLIYKFC